MNNVNNRYYDRYQRNRKHDQFYHSKAWIQLREYIRIRDNGLCQQCLKEKRITVGTIADHIIPIELDWAKRLDEDNIQLLCQPCHNTKTAEDRTSKQPKSKVKIIKARANTEYF